MADDERATRDGADVPEAEVETESEPEADERLGDTVARPTTKLPVAEGAGADDGVDAAADGPASGEASGADGARASRSWWDSRAHKLVALAGVVALGIAAAIGISLVVPPELTSRQVAEDFDAAQFEDGGLTSSVYASNVGYAIESEEVTSIEDDGDGRKVAHVSVVYANDSFEVACVGTQRYELVGRDWVAGEARLTSVSATPVAPVDADLAIDDIGTILAKVARHDGTSLASLYGDGDFEAASAELDDDAAGCTLVIRCEATNGLYQYSGEITATFAFEAGESSTDAGSWRLVSAAADDGCWERGIASPEGAWSGELETSATSSFLINTGVCYAGQASPLELEVSDYDVDTGRMRADVTFVSHDHEAIAEDADATAGDATVELEGISVALDPETLEGTWRHTGTDGSEGYYELEFRNDGGAWSVVVRSSVLDTASFSWGTTTFTDTYSLTRMGAVG